MKTKKEEKIMMTWEKKNEGKGKCFCEVKKECKREAMHERRMEMQEKNGKKHEENGREEINEMIRGEDGKTLMSSFTSFV